MGFKSKAVAVLTSVSAAPAVFAAGEAGDIAGQITGMGAQLTAIAAAVAAVGIPFAIALKAYTKGKQGVNKA